jgi:hypothetical protein
MTVHSRSLRLASALIATLAAAAVTACANPVEQLMSSGAESALESLIEQGAGDGSIDLDGDGMTITTDEGGTIEFGGTASLPSDWPGLPLPEGAILTSYDAPDGFALTIATNRGEVDKLIASLESSGFEVTDSLEIAELKTYLLSDATHRLTLGWIPEDNDQGSLQYMVNSVS